jgi:hypothetical protein
MKRTLWGLASLGSIALGGGRVLRGRAGALVSFYSAGSRTLPPGAPDEAGPDGFRRAVDIWSSTLPSAPA